MRRFCKSRVTEILFLLISLYTVPQRKIWIWFFNLFYVSYGRLVFKKCANLHLTHYASINLFKVDNINTEKLCETCSNLRTKTPERCQCRRSGVFIVYRNIFHSFSVFSIAGFKQVNLNYLVVVSHNN